MSLTSNQNAPHQNPRIKKEVIGGEVVGYFNERGERIVSRTLIDTESKIDPKDKNPLREATSSEKEYLGQQIDNLGFNNIYEILLNLITLYRTVDFPNELRLKIIEKLIEIIEKLNLVESRTKVSSSDILFIVRGIYYFKNEILSNENIDEIRAYILAKQNLINASNSIPDETRYFSRIIYQTLKRANQKLLNGDFTPIALFARLDHVLVEEFLKCCPRISECSLNSLYSEEMKPEFPLKISFYDREFKNKIKQQLGMDFDSMVVEAKQRDLEIIETLVDNLCLSLEKEIPDKYKVFSTMPKNPKTGSNIFTLQLQGNVIDSLKSLIETLNAAQIAYLPIALREILLEQLL